ncbi:hypothetical protein Tco_0972065 [Tanacetum coccineum]
MCDNDEPICEYCGGYHMDYQCTQPSEEIDKIIQRTQERGMEICRQNEERNRVHEELMQMLRELIKVQDEKRIAKEKEAVELEAKRKSQECLNTKSSAITPDLPIPDSLIMEDEHLDTIPVTESANTIKSSVEDLVPTPNNPLFESKTISHSDDESLSEEEIQKDEFKYFSNPLYDLDDEIITNEKILPNQKDLDVVIPIPPGIDERCFNAESDLLESLLNRDSPIDSTKIDSIFDEFSLPRPPEESNSEISDATIESLSPSPILVEDSDSLMEEVDLFLASDDSMPSGIEIDDYDSEGDIRFS